MFIEAWTIDKKTTDTCLLHVSKASDYEEGIWRCDLQSLPIKERYIDDGKNIEVRLIKPPKVGYFLMFYILKIETL